jgi:16S rRNA (uracil1498-N3)-methyltransferase
MPRIYCPVPLASGATLDLPGGAARHVQVLRLQPGHGLTLFNGQGGEFDAVVQRMGRSEVQVQVGTHHAIERELSRQVHLALGVPVGDRMDWLVEKATELGVASITPLMTERSVLRLSGERAQKKQDHWQAVAVAACEQCGRNRMPVVQAVQSLHGWLGQVGHGEQAFARRALLSLRAEGLTLAHWALGQAAGPVVFLSGPEGGLSAPEEDAALDQGFSPVSLGDRVLRAETAPLAALAVLGP